MVTVILITTVCVQAIYVLTRTPEARGPGIDLRTSR